MNIFLVHEDYNESAEQLAKADPIRARKQLVECCQLLAHMGPMHKAGDILYRLTHKNHPIVRHMKLSYEQYWLCFTVAYGLAQQFPKHACGKSLDSFWLTHDFPMYTVISPGKIAQVPHNYILCRKGQPQIYVQTLQEYAAIMRDYCITVKGMKL